MTAHQRIDDSGVQLAHGPAWANRYALAPMTNKQSHDDGTLAAVRAEQAGSDGVGIHGAHGFLLAQFLDQRNQRRDGYDGTLEHHMRALVEVLTGIRAATGDGFQVGVRLSPAAKGSPLDVGREVARQILGSGVVDFVDMSLFDVYATPHHNGGGGLLIDHFTGLPVGTRC